MKATDFLPALALALGVTLAAPAVRAADNDAAPIQVPAAELPPGDGDVVAAPDPGLAPPPPDAPPLALPVEDPAGFPPPGGDERGPGAGPGEGPRSAPFDRLGTGGDRGPGPDRPVRREFPSRATTRPSMLAPSGGSTNALPEGTRNLTFNFRGVPLEMVLDYLSDAAGFIINLETEVKGKVDVWSSQPLNRDEAFSLLNTVLNKNGYAALRNGRTLTVVSRDEARKRDTPVISGSNPDDIPRSDEIVTQILPVRYISATQIAKDLQPLLPTTGTVAANEGGNALVVTDTQANIRRLAEIVQALDTAIASVSSVRVFTLQHADAKSLATIIRDLFTTDTTRTGGNQNNAARFFAQFRGQGGGGGGGDAASASGGRAPTPKVTAVADERSNSLVVSAPEEQMEVIAGVVLQMDTSVEDITELRVFRLRHADPQETADLLTDLFDTTARAGSQSGGPGGQVRFGGAFGGPGGRMNMAPQNNASSQSARMQQQTRVVAVPDLRTGSVVVSAARDLLDQIGRMIEQLDADPARKQKVFVYSVENTDPQAVQEVLQNLFPNQTTSNGRQSQNTQRQNSNQLNNRQTQNRNNNTGNRSNTGLGNTTSGFGGNNTR